MRAQSLAFFAATFLLSLPSLAQPEGSPNDTDQPGSPEPDLSSPSSETSPRDERRPNDSTSAESSAEANAANEPDRKRRAPPERDPAVASRSENSSAATSGNDEAATAHDSADAETSEVAPAVPKRVSPPSQPREERAAPATDGDEAPSLFSVKLNGKIKPTLIVGTGIESYGRPNASAPTAAVHPVLAESPDEVGVSFQAQQTRFGIKGSAGPVTGFLEVDFIDFSQSSPTTTVRPRLRIAEVVWNIDSKTVLEAGQTWDLVAPVLPHGFNLVGAFFQAGNSAFMRHQIRVRRVVGDFELAAGVGSAASNSSTPWGNAELGQIPAALARVQYQPDDDLTIGVSGLAVRSRFAPETHEMAYHGAVHAQWKPGRADLRMEAYLSRNGANTGLLNLSQGYVEDGEVVSLTDAGAFVSARGYLSDSLALYSSVGAAAVLNPDDVPTGVARDVEGQPVRARAGIEYNAQARIGASWDINQYALLYAEPYYYLTHHELEADDAERFDEQRSAYGAEVGAMFHF